MDDLACHTDETVDARELYSAAAATCEDCVTAAQSRGAAVLLVIDDDAPTDVTSLAKAALALGQRADARGTAPRASASKTVVKT